MKKTSQLAASLVLASCAFFPTFKALGDSSLETVGCVSFEDDFYDDLTAQVRQYSTLQAPADFEASVQEAMKAPRFQGLSATERERLIDELSAVYKTVSVDALTGASTAEERLEILAATEIGDRTSIAKDSLQARLTLEFAQLESFAATLKLKCETAPKRRAAIETLPTDSLLGMLQRTRAPAVYGGLKAMATAYQSCEVARQTPLDKTTPDAVGIKAYGFAADGIGKKRKITDLKQLDSTDPYLKNYRRPQSSCFDILASPLIYNYGGKPDPSGGDLNFFKHAGSGTQTLGVDCSGYIYTSLATAGLKLRKKGRLKADNVTGVKASMYMNPQRNGLTCFDFPTFTAQKSIEPGDILASGGHVIMVESIGADPFGIADIHDQKDCKLENMSISRFDFNILQSAPVKGDIGINRIKVADYIGTEKSMATALLQDAVVACQARFRNGGIGTHSGGAALVRHSDSSDCRDTPIRLTNESCLSSCSAQ